MTINTNPKRLLTTLMATALLLTVSLTAKAEAEDIQLIGYTNVYIKVKSTVEDGGRVYIGTDETRPQFKRQWYTDHDYKASLPVYSYMGDFRLYMFFLFALPESEANYTFAGWYADNGDGQFSLDSDENITAEFYPIDNDNGYLGMFTLDEGTTVYATEAEAASASWPDTPAMTIFGHFTRGAQIGVSFYQDDALEHSNCGSVFTDKPINNPGDQLTVRALPNDGYRFEYWQDATRMGNIVSRDNPYTFTVKGGEKLYAYFSAIDAPKVTLPQEGGFAVMYTGKDSWLLHDQSVASGARVLIFEAEDLIRTTDGKAYFNMDDEVTQWDVTQRDGIPTIVYGKGEVSFAFKLQFGNARKMSREALVQWSGDKGIVISAPDAYVYVFRVDLGAFIQVGNTDTLIPNDKTSDKVSVPPHKAYFYMLAHDLTDDQGNIPNVIGCSASYYDSAVAGIQGVENILPAVDGAIYDLQGRRVGSKDQLKPGIYVQNGRKFVRK